MKNVLYHPAVILVVTSLVILSIFSLRRNLKRLSLSQENLKSAQQAHERQQWKLAEDEALLNKLQQPLTQEKIARNALLVQKEDEISIKLPDIVLEQSEPEKIIEPTVIEQWKEVLSL